MSRTCTARNYKSSDTKCWQRLPRQLSLAHSLCQPCRERRCHGASEIQRRQYGAGNGSSGHGLKSILSPHSNLQGPGSFLQLDVSLRHGMIALGHGAGMPLNFFRQGDKSDCPLLSLPHVSAVA